MIYCYECTHCGRKVEKDLTMSKSTKRVNCSCGRKMRRDIVAEHGGHATSLGNWPLESDAAGIDPSQIPEAMAYAEKRGVPTNFNPETGAAIFTSQDHRKRYCNISGLYDRNAGYGDPSPDNNMRKRRKRRRQNAGNTL